MKYTYRSVSEITDFGPCITKLILHLPEKTDTNNISREHFNVYVERKDQNTGKVLMLQKDWNSKDTFPSKGYRKVIDAYASDSNGNKLASGEFATLQLEYGPMLPLSSELAYIHPLNSYVRCDFRITQLQEIPVQTGSLSGLVYTKCSGEIRIQTQNWLNSQSSHPEIPLRYGYYAPREQNAKRPLVIWLHGAGEGGQNPTLAYTGNKVVSLSSPPIQDIFESAYMLAPQSPTMWMDDGTGQYTKSGRSKYTKVLKYLIDEFMLLMGNIDANRVYIGGCSNGGFMTMRMIIDYPHFFAAAYPVCEALFDEVISNEEINLIKDIPIWFTHTKNDPVVKPDVTVLPTYKRLIEAGGKNIHLSYFDNVIDTSGKYKDENGNPYEYHGHFSWIYTLNNECQLDYDNCPVTANDEMVTLFKWLSLQSK